MNNVPTFHPHPTKTRFRFSKVYIIRVCVKKVGVIKVNSRISSVFGKKRRADEKVEREFQIETLLSDFSNKNIKKHGLTSSDYVRLLRKQNLTCVICQKGFSKKIEGQRIDVTVDHDHATGKVRGLLCGQCNMLLGQAKDNPRTLAHAINYLMTSATDLPQKMKFDDALIALLKNILWKMEKMRHKASSSWYGTRRYRW
ncbi:MAG TPA: hypothetical protein ENI05_04450 [Porticoccus sp.]|nr:hypothetical protein [Porticoccus sp.]